MKTRKRRQHKIVTSDFSKLSRNYRIVYADPPWSYYGDPNKSQAAGKHYSTMTIEELLALPVPSIMLKRSVLLMWVTSPLFDVGIDLIRGWGLHYRGVAKVWVKTRRDGQIINGQGSRPSIVKPTTEFLVAASKIQKGRPLSILDEGQRQVVPHPRGEHSEKPTVIMDEIVRLFGDVKRVELFARRTRLGWDSFGNQLKFDYLDTYRVGERA